MCPHHSLMWLRMLSSTDDSRIQALSMMWLLYCRILFIVAPCKGKRVGVRFHGISYSQSMDMVYITPTHIPLARSESHCPSQTYITLSHPDENVDLLRAQEEEIGLVSKHLVSLPKLHFPVGAS